VSESDTIGTIETAKNEAIQEYRNRTVDAQDRNDTTDYNEAVDALRAIDDAWEWIQANREPSTSLVDPQPLEGETPYAVLGITEETASRQVRNRREELVEEYRERMVDAQHRNDTDDYSEAADALRAVDEAYDALELEAAAPSPSAVPGDTPHEILGVGEAASLSEAAERRDELLAEYTTELSAELYERDPWRFRQLVAAVERVDDAWVTLSSRKDIPEINTG
jgi:flagellin-specific chaperone FliS